jgi:hypothetical protein
MKIPKLKKGDIYEIIWIDNNVMNQIGWIEWDELLKFAKDNTDAFIRSVGILHDHDKIFVTLVGDLDLDTSRATMRVIKILKTCICHIRSFAPTEISNTAPAQKEKRKNTRKAKNDAA